MSFLLKSLKNDVISSPPTLKNIVNEYILIVTVKPINNFRVQLSCRALYCLLLFGIWRNAVPVTQFPEHLFIFLGKDVRSSWTHFRNNRVYFFRSRSGSPEEKCIDHSIKEAGEYVETIKVKKWLPFYRWWCANGIIFRKCVSTPRLRSLFWQYFTRIRVICYRPVER